MHSLCKKHGIEFVALCAREYDGTPIMWNNSWSVAVDVMKQREQAAQMHFDLMGLADAIRTEKWAPVLEAVEPEQLNIETGA